MVIKELYQNEEKLLARGFKKRDIILHPSRMDYGAEEEFTIFIGQEKPIYVKQVCVARFNYHVAVNHRDEVYVFVNGFMNKEMDVYKDLNSLLNDSFYQGRYPEMIAAVTTEINALQLLLEGGK